MFAAQKRQLGNHGLVDLRWLCQRALCVVRRERDAMFQMLDTALYLGVDILVYWQYGEGNGWIRYSASEGAACKEAFLVQCIHSEKYKMFHCEPICDWPIEE